MPKYLKEENLSTRTSRDRLAVRKKPYFRGLDEGLHIGYRKSVGGSAWVVRWYLGDGQYASENLVARPDDVLDADGLIVLNWAQAQKAARELFQRKQREIAGVAIVDAAPIKVREAIAEYIAFLKAERKTGTDTEQRLNKHVAQALGEKAVVELTQEDVESFKRAMVRHDPDDHEVERRSKDSANRVLTSFKAAMNRAFNDPGKKIPSDVAWRRVKAFRNVGRPRDVHLDAKQSLRLVNGTTGAFQRLVTAALLTGARPPHELAACRVKSFSRISGTLSVPDGKTGSRDIVLTAEAIRFFTEITKGRDANDLLLPKNDGTPWGKNHHQRLMADAVVAAKLPSDTTIYALRHTHASQSILAGINLKLLAENMGTSIRMLEKHYGKFIAASRRKLVEQSSFKLGLGKAQSKRPKSPDNQLDEAA